MVSELFSGRTAIHILIAEINKVLLAEATLGLNARCDRLGKRNRDAGLIARQNLGAVEIVAIRNGIEMVCLKLLADEIEKWGKVVKFSGARPD